MSPARERRKKDEYVERREGRLENEDADRRAGTDFFNGSERGDQSWLTGEPGTPRN